MSDQPCGYSPPGLRRFRVRVRVRVTVTVRVRGRYRGDIGPARVEAAQLRPCDRLLQLA